MKDILQLAKPIKLVIFDVDGIMTDASLYITDQNIEMKAFNSQDGLGIKFLQHSGIKVAVITARESNIVINRMQSLGIEHIYQGNSHKVEAYEDVLKKLKVKDSEVAYAGDDILDLPLIRRAHLGISVPNGNDFVKQHADWVTTKAGGHGAVREICELIMTAQNTLEDLYNSFL